MRELLAGIARAQAAPHRMVTRAKILLAADVGHSNAAIAAQVGVHIECARRKRFVQVGVATSIKPPKPARSTGPARQALW